MKFSNYMNLLQLKSTHTYVIIVQTLQFGFRFNSLSFLDNNTL